MAELARNEVSAMFLAVMDGPGGVQKPCVVRRLRAARTTDKTLRSQLLGAAAVGARIHHPNVVETYSSGEAGGLPFIVMEYVSGASVRAVLRASQELGVPVPTGASLRIVCDALYGLHYLHTAEDFDGSALRLIHRLVSASKIIVGFDGRARLTDLRGAVPLATADAVRLEVIVGKQGYLAPEYIGSGRVNPRTDVYGMGVVLWELLTGERAAAQPRPASASTAFLPAPSQHSRVGDATLDAIVATAVAANPGQRYGTALELAWALEQYAAMARIDTHRDVVEDMLIGFFADARERVRARMRTAMHPILAHPQMASRGIPDLEDDRISGDMDYTRPDNPLAASIGLLMTANEGGVKANALRVVR